MLLPEDHFPDLFHTENDRSMFVGVRYGLQRQMILRASESDAYKAFQMYHGRCDRSQKRLLRQILLLLRNSLRGEQVSVFLMSDQHL